MRKTTLLLAAVMAGTLHAQDNNLLQSFSLDSSTTPPTFNFSWWGTSGKHYLVEVTEDLSVWSFLPDTNPRGTDTRIEVGFLLDASRQFVRALQFDPSDISGMADSDGDGLPDKWELYQFGNLSRDGTGDYDDDGLTDLEEFQFGMNPKVNETTANVSLFSYDATGRLTGVSANGFSASFTLDPEGNVTNAN